MRKPKLSEFDDGCGNIDYEAYDETMDDWGDMAYEEARDRQMEEDMEREMEEKDVKK